jgi:succinate-semialdehyde dehydrogenase/glutarate-semialdehyde dehydrogenase
MIREFFILPCAEVWLMHPVYIDGAWANARTASAREIQNPATLKTLDTLPDCGGEDVERAVGAATAAQPAWGEIPPAERVALLREMGRRVRAQHALLALSLSSESGKPLCEARDCIAAAADMFERCGHIERRGDTERGDPDAASPVPAQAGRHARVQAVITPYNFPVLAFAASAVAALAAGATLVCKPPPQNPLTLLELVRLCDSLPAGVINVITGGADSAERLVAHPQVNRVSFTGSATVACRLQALARGKSLDLETGSLDVFMVCKDADLERAVPAIAWSRLMNAGQTCASPRHIYVERAIAGELAERMHQYVGFLDVDDPAKSPTDLGPLISLEAAQRVEDQVGRALRAGARLILGGRRFRPSGLPGHFFQPTILGNVPAGSAPTREEILGPVITLTPVIDLADALELSSQAAMPTRAWIHTRDPEAATRTVQARSGGTFFINDPGDSKAGPFGGLRPGRVLAALAALPAQNPLPRIARIGTAVEPKSWWFPYLERKS